ncbi:indole-3-glycerol phosphate synthase TrpC [Alkalihalobacillus pseudalcaliphilus]|uniref:indole-3-glycerol phosphate synthase TrpC n=1 Tax=Alkalihalobacillus pseudalcaliphilus TaxID=79884 RepID=UPI00064DF416|nr:indole-3-glycerol phosphate synthase TrpC [Alkalihalobacillus pseudalcaliphilus]KMK76434.1 indole-3-glycerol phosphate synthase [Alkalihalobacillus pseudalcaliphilus]
MLNQILATKKKEIAELVQPKPLEVKHYSLYEALNKCRRHIGLIAEVKKASPSKGIIKEDFNPLQIALGYERAGADAISVLTDQTYFQGSVDYLSQIKQHVQIPVMRKDFIISFAQIDETKNIGADALLLIVGTLPIEELKELYDYSYSLGLECLVEVHSEEDLHILLACFTPAILGINNRNLKTFKTDLAQTKEMIPLISRDTLVVSESGIATAADIDFVALAGAKAILIGETFMRASSPEQGIYELLGGELDVTKT